VIQSRLYFGTVMHRRLRPRLHELSYRLFWMLIDLDEAPELQNVSALFSHNRANLLSFHDRDHGDGSGEPLRPQVERLLADNGIAFDGGPIHLFCMPRVLGYGFNPISVYYCYRKQGALAAIVYEVRNTFGERHSYVFDMGDAGRPAVHGCAKCFHVSPFMDMDMRYEFRTHLPTERIALAIKGLDAGGTIIHASLAGTAAPFSSRGLFRGLILYPLCTVKVMGAIHWHALLLWMKKIQVRRKPAPPSATSTKATPLSPAPLPMENRAAALSAGQTVNHRGKFQSSKISIKSDI
jgi:DUF1365 family protein